MNNYEFCTQWILEQKQEDEDIQVLDYGCGGGEIVKLLRQNHVSALGCDVFYEGCEYPELMASELFGTVILQMDGNKIPFPDNYFDLIVNNQVMEHVEDLDNALSEIDRVLKPSGRVLSIFPDGDVWNEVHTKIPFLHWFPKSSQFRIYYALFFTFLGFGSCTRSEDKLKWIKYSCLWLDKWTHYRGSQEIDCYYNRYFVEIQSIEADWLKQRLQDRVAAIKWIPVAIASAIARKLAGRVIIAQSKAHVSM